MKRIIWNIGFSLLAAGVAIAAGDATKGKAVYDKACKSCHGVDGRANPAIAKSMKVDMLHLGDPAVQKLRDDQLKSCITNGEGKMRAIKSVSGAAADDAVAYLRTFKQ